MSAIAWLGAGLMGRWMAARLAAAGHEVHVWNRTRAKAEAVEGAIPAASAEEAVRKAEIVFLMLADARAIEEVLFTAPLDLAGKLVVQMGTIAPSESRAFAKRCQAQGARYLEAPVLGSQPEAKAGTLIVMAGGRPEDFARAKALLEVLGKHVVHLGEVGKASAMKLAMNMLIATETAAFALALAWAEREGLEIEAMMEILRQSALYAPTFDKKLPRMLARNYADPNFPTRHLAKDIRLFLEEARTLGLRAEPAEAARAWIEEAMAEFADADYSAIAEVPRRPSRTSPRP